MENTVECPICNRSIPAANATAHVNRCLDNPTAPTPVNPQLPITPHRNVEEIPDNPRRRAQVTEFKTDVPPIPAIGTVVVPGRDWSAGRRRGRNLGVLQRGVVTAHREFNHIPNSAVEIVWDTGPRTQVLRWGVTGRSVSTRVQKRTNMALDPAQRIVEELDNRLPLSRFFDVCPIPSSMQYVADSKAAQVMSETIKLPPSTVQGVLFVKVERCRGLRNGVSNKYASVTYSYVTEQSKLVSGKNPKFGYQAAVIDPQYLGREPVEITIHSKPFLQPSSLIGTVKFPVQDIVRAQAARAKELTKVAEPHRTLAAEIIQYGTTVDIWAKQATETASLIRTHTRPPTPRQPIATDPRSIGMALTGPPLRLGSPQNPCPPALQERLRQVAKRQLSEHTHVAEALSTLARGPLRTKGQLTRRTIASGDQFDDWVASWGEVLRSHTPSAAAEGGAIEGKEDDSPMQDEGMRRPQVSAVSDEEAFVRAVENEVVASAGWTPPGQHATDPLAIRAWFPIAGPSDRCVGYKFPTCTPDVSNSKEDAVDTMPTAIALGGRKTRDASSLPASSDYADVESEAYGGQYGHGEVLLTLRYVPLEQILTPIGPLRRTPLHWAALDGHYALLQAFGVILRWKSLISGLKPQYVGRALPMGTAIMLQWLFNGDYRTTQRTPLGMFPHKNPTLMPTNLHEDVVQAAEYGMGASLLQGAKMASQAGFTRNIMHPFIRDLVANPYDNREEFGPGYVSDAQGFVRGIWPVCVKSLDTLARHDGLWAERGADGLSIADLASIGGTEDHLKCLHLYCVNRNFSSSSAESPIRNALHHAVLGSHVPTIEFVRKAAPSLLRQGEAMGFTPLSLAAALGRSDIVHLLETGQVPNIVKGLWQKVLKLLRLRRNIAGIDAPERGQGRVVDNHWTLGPSSTVLASSVGGNNATMLSAGGLYLDTLKSFEQTGALRSTRNHAGNTPLHFAVAAAAADAPSPLYDFFHPEFGSAMDNVDAALTDQKQGPLSRNSSSLVHPLLRTLSEDQLARIVSRPQDALSAFIVASLVNGSRVDSEKEDRAVAALSFLITHSDVFTPNREKASPLHIAAAIGSTKILQALLQYCAHHSSSTILSSKTASGETPLQIAERLGHNAAAKLLRTYTKQDAAVPTSGAARATEALPEDPYDEEYDPNEEEGRSAEYNPREGAAGGGAGGGAGESKGGAFYRVWNGRGWPTMSHTYEARGVIQGGSGGEESKQPMLGPQEADGDEITHPLLRLHPSVRQEIQELIAKWSWECSMCTLRVHWYEPVEQCPACGAKCSQKARECWTRMAGDLAAMSSSRDGARVGGRGGAMETKEDATGTKDNGFDLSSLMAADALTVDVVLEAAGVASTPSHATQRKDSDDPVLPPARPQLKRQSSLEVWEPVDVIRRRGELVLRCSAMLGFPLSVSGVLLGLHKWSLDDLANLCTEKGEAVLREAHFAQPVIDQWKSAQAGQPAPRAQEEEEEDPEELVDCDACLEEVPRKELVGMDCTHRFCGSCWKNHLDAAVTKGPHCVFETQCLAAPSCQQIVDEISWKRFATPETFITYRRFLLWSYIDRNPNLIRCANPRGCSKVLFSTGNTTDLACTCGYRFCARCQLPSHTPATCEDSRKWNDTVSSATDKASISHMMENFKRCPKCKAFIQKSTGCKHMTCSSCRHEFCWNCKALWTGYNHRCQKYNDVSPMGANKWNEGTLSSEETSLLEKKEALDENRFQYYFTRVSTQSTAQEQLVARLRALDFDKPPVTTIAEEKKAEGLQQADTKKVHHSVLAKWAKKQDPRFAAMSRKACTQFTKRSTTVNERISNVLQQYTCTSVLSDFQSRASSSTFHSQQPLFFDHTTNETVCAACAITSCRGHVVTYLGLLNSPCMKGASVEMYNNDDPPIPWSCIIDNTPPEPRDNTFRFPNVPALGVLTATSYNATMQQEWKSLVLQQAISTGTLRPAVAATPHLGPQVQSSSAKKLEAMKSSLAGVSRTTAQHLTDVFLEQYELHQAVKYGYIQLFYRQDEITEFAVAELEEAVEYLFALTDIAQTSVFSMDFHAIEATLLKARNAYQRLLHTHSVAEGYRAE